MRQRGQPALTPDRLPMAILFNKIYKTLDPCDAAWQGVRRAALQFLTDFAQVSLYTSFCILLRLSISSTSDPDL